MLSLLRSNVPQIPHFGNHIQIDLARFLAETKPVNQTQTIVTITFKDGDMASFVKNGDVQSAMATVEYFWSADEVKSLKFKAMAVSNG